MSQPLLTEPPEKTKQRIERREPRPESTRSFQGGTNPILQLQRTLGNRHVAQLIQAKRLTPEGRIIGLQPKLTVGAADDQYEQEADRVARQVVSMPDSVALASVQQSHPVEGEPGQAHIVQSKPLPLAASITPFVQRKTEPGEVKVEEEKDKEDEKDEPFRAMFLGKSAALPFQRLTAEEEEPEAVLGRSAKSLVKSFEAGDEVESRLNQSKGQGSPLPDHVRSYMEPRFGVDFSHVHVHTGSSALQMNRDIGAQAFTHDSDIYYGAGVSPTDLELTAHELTHVVQQTGAMPLQAKRSLESSPQHPALPIQRICKMCEEEEKSLRRKSIRPLPYQDNKKNLKQRTPMQAQRISRTAVSLQRYSWAEFTDDVTSVGEAAVEGAQAVGEAVVSGAETVGEAIVSGAESMVEAGGEAVDWLLTEAGQVALDGANALAGLVGGGVTVGPNGLIIDIPEIELFDSYREEIIPPTPRLYIPLLGAGIIIGPVALVGSVGIPVGAPTLTVFLGPGRLQNIRIRIDPAASTYSAGGELYVGAALNAYKQTGAAVRVDALTAIPTEPPIPVQAALEGGLLLTLQGSGLGSITNAVTLAYSRGAISFDRSITLQLGVILEADLDAYLNAQLYEVELCEFIWPLAHWEMSAAESYSLPISVSFSGGAASITIGPMSGGTIPVEDIDTALERFRPETRCKAIEEVIEELCEREILPPDVCEALDEEEPEVLKEITASGRCKCVGDDSCGGGRIYEVCFRTQKDCKKVQKDLDKFCNNNSEMKEKCTRPKCYYRHSDPKCPDDCDPGTITPLEESQPGDFGGGGLRGDDFGGSGGGFGGGGAGRSFGPDSIAPNPQPTTPTLPPVLPFFHGSTWRIAQSIPGHVKPIGGGDFGQGFYTHHDSDTNRAAERARWEGCRLCQKMGPTERYAGVIRFDVTRADYESLFTKRRTFGLTSTTQPDYVERQEEWLDFVSGPGRGRQSDPAFEPAHMSWRHQRIDPPPDPGYLLIEGPMYRGVEGLPGPSVPPRSAFDPYSEGTALPQQVVWNHAPAMAILNATVTTLKQYDARNDCVPVDPPAPVSALGGPAVEDAHAREAAQAEIRGG